MRSMVEGAGERAALTLKRTCGRKKSENVLARVALVPSLHRLRQSPSPELSLFNAATHDAICPP
jgi:hypothetical protein